jgi:hypothetical protein
VQASHLIIYKVITTPVQPNNAEIAICLGNLVSDRPGFESQFEAFCLRVRRQRPTGISSSTLEFDVAIIGKLTRERSLGKIRDR